MKTVEKTPKVDIIWNITRICMWDCANCCVDALHVARRGQHVLVRSESLQRETVFPFHPQAGTIYDQALTRLQTERRELDLSEKLRVLDHLRGFRPRLDFSGGDPLATAETLTVMQAAATRFGKAHLTLTATGAGLTRYDPEQLAPLIGELNFTYDSSAQDGNAHRPSSYASGNLRGASQFARKGVTVRAECPLSRHNCSPQHLEQLYLELQEANIQTLLLMRLFPVGRGGLVEADIPTAEQYRRAIDTLRSLEACYGTPRIKLQCALRFFDQADLTTNPCDLLHESLGLMADGTLLLSPWAVNAVGAPLSDTWVLGNLATTPLTVLLQSDRASVYRERLDDNFGHCKIFSYLHSQQGALASRLFDQADPLYTPVAASASNQWR